MIDCHADKRCNIYIASANLLQPTSHDTFIYTSGRSDTLVVFLETVAF